MLARHESHDATLSDWALSHRLLSLLPGISQAEIAKLRNENFALSQQVKWEEEALSDIKAGAAKVFTEVEVDSERSALALLCAWALLPVSAVHRCLHG